MIIGHKRQREYLKSVRERGTEAHAYLFFGPEHIGKLAVAEDWIKSFFPKEDALLIDEGRHPDVLIVSKEKLLVTDNKKEIGIDDVLEIRRRASLRPQSGEYSFIVIDGADDLSEEAQNSFLKVLEEPPSYVRFLLITDSPETLLPTVVSRAISMEFLFVSDGDIKAFLSKSEIPERNQEKILLLSQGRPGVAVRATQDKVFFEEESALLETFQKVISGDMLSQFFWSESAFGAPEVIEKFIFFLLHDLRKKAIAEQAPAALASSKFVLSALELLRRTNMNKRLLLDTIFLTLSQTPQPAAHAPA